MNDDTISLLKECNAGCKMATSSIEQVMPSVMEEKMRELLHHYNRKHIAIGDACHELLNKEGKDEKDPHPIAKAFSWFSAEMKMMINDKPNHIAKLLMDGCNMGIQSVSEYLNKYETADEKSKELAKQLVNCEEEFLDKLKEFL